jgi:hypothetical protein
VTLRSLKRFRNSLDRRRLILFVAIPATTVIGVALLTWALERFLNASGGTWSVAVQLVSTIVLLVVTAMYVYLTYIMLNVQERPLAAIRLSRQEDAVRDLIRLYVKRALEISSIADMFPLDTSQESDSWKQVEKEREATGIASQYADDLFELAPFLPAELRPAAMKTIFVIYLAGIFYSALYVSVLETKNKGMDSQPPVEPTWESIKAHYYLKQRDELTGKPEWDAITDGQMWKAASRANDALHERADKYLQGTLT